MIFQFVNEWIGNTYVVFCYNSRTYSCDLTYDGGVFVFCLVEFGFFFHEMALFLLTWIRSILLSFLVGTLQACRVQSRKYAAFAKNILLMEDWHLLSGFAVPLIFFLVVNYACLWFLFFLWHVCAALYATLFLYGFLCFFFPKDRNPQATMVS